MLNNKIKNILLIKDLSPSRFADEIGVQRSSISHILSGRNKPSLEIVQKIIRRFPDLGMEWILEEDEDVEIEEDIVDAGKNSKSHQEIKPQPNHDLKSTNTNSKESEQMQDRQIEKILIFYTDKTFIEYKPS